MPTWFEKRKKAKELATYGVTIHDINETPKYNRFILCLLKGFLVFLASYGTIDGVLSAFSISYNRTVIVPFLLLISMFVSCLYLHKIFFYVGYVILLITFTVELVRYYLYANSGYQAIINILYEEYSYYFNLHSVREAQEFYSDRYLTITIALIFIGVFLTLILNVTISGYMNVAETALITAPFLEIGLFIGKRPSLLSLGCLLCVYITVFILQRSKNSRMQVKGHRTKELLRMRRKKSDFFLYQGNVTGVLYSFLIASLLSILIVFALSPLYGYENAEEYNKTSLRKGVDEYVKIFVQTGFTGLLDRYSSSGGLNNGRLGGVSSVRPDFEIDLQVTFVPYTTETVYLKAFTGNMYTGSSWYNTILIDSNANVSASQILFGDYEREMYEADFRHDFGSFARMDITNIGADTSFQYLPYYSYPTDVTVPVTQNTKPAFPLNSTMSVTYTPNLPVTYSGKALQQDERYQQYLDGSCLSVPQDLETSLQSWCKKADLPGIFGDFSDSAEPYASTTEYRLAVAQAIKETFMEEYPYTMSPGATPYNRDFVDYFLFTQKRGYCAHFASSATLLLRSMGIPARYIEGYCIPLSVISESTPLITEDYDEWYQGDNLLSDYLSESGASNYGVVRADVTDAYAHAWVEIYLDDFGWVPYEFTPPSFENTSPDTSSLLANLFGNIFNLNIPVNVTEQPLEDTMVTDIKENSMFSMNPSLSVMLFPIVCILIVIITGILLYLLLGLLRKYTQIKKMKDNEDYAGLISHYYLSLLMFLSRKKLIDKENPMVSDVLPILQQLYPDKNNEDFLHFMEQACFSNLTLSKEKVEQYLITCNSYRKDYKRKKSE